MSTTGIIWDPEINEYHRDRLLDILEKLNIKGAAPSSDHELLRRILNNQVDFDTYGGADMGEAMKRIRR